MLYSCRSSRSEHVAVQASLGGEDTDGSSCTEAISLDVEGPLVCFLRMPTDSEFRDRLLQVKPRKALRLLRVDASDASIDSAGSSSLNLLPKGLLEEADGRGLDGLMLMQLGIVVLLRPAEQVVLIDDDKRTGLRQELLTDMFMR